MIKIDNNNIAEIEEKHLKYCKPYVSKCLKFYYDFFNRLGNKTKIKIIKNESLESIYNIDSITIKTMILPFLKPKYKKDGKSRMTINHVKSLLTTRNNDIIWDVKNLDYFKEFFVLIQKIENDVKDILVGRPKCLDKLKVETLYQIKDKNWKYVIEQIFRYDIFVNKGFEIDDKHKWGSYTLTSILGVSVCPYCNRNWISTVGSQSLKITSPQLDHYFSQSDYPILRLSLYNLIPSCETCNSRIKSSKEFVYDVNLHPYEDGYENNVTFFAVAKNVQSANGLANDFIINIKPNEFGNWKLIEKAMKNNDFFKIKEIYECHGDIVAELFMMKTKYGVNFLKTLRTNMNFPDSISAVDLYRIAFANYYFEKDFNKRPFSKLTKDIVKQLELIK